MAPYWAMIDAILGGEGAIKAEETTYLPQFANEKDSIYEARLAHTPFTNIFADILKNLASKPFSKPIVMADGTPEQFETLAENIDGQGNNLHVFASQTFHSALGYAIDWILVEFTRAKPRPDGKPLSKAEEKEQGLRPYWVHIPAQRMLAVYSDFIGGVEIIHHARISETSTQIEGFKEVSVERVRVLMRDPIVDVDGDIVDYGPARWELWEQSESDGKSSWAIVESGDITIGVIPLVPVVLTKRQGGSWVIDPALRDLAYMQLTELRQESALEWVKIMTCYPMVCVSGMETQTANGEPIEIIVGPNTVFLIPQNQQGTGPAGDVKVVEPGAQSIKENREQLELTRKEMRDLGMQPMTQSALTVVTTANVSKKASSAVQAWAFLFQDALETAWKYTAMWLNETIEPEVVIHTDFAIELESGKELTAVIDGAKNSIWSKQTAFEEAKRRNVIVTDRNFEEEQELVAGEQEGEQLKPEQMIDPVTGQPVVTPVHGSANPPQAA